MRERLHAGKGKMGEKRGKGKGPASQGRDRRRGKGMCKEGRLKEEGEGRAGSVQFSSVRIFV